MASIVSDILGGSTESQTKPSGSPDQIKQNMGELKKTPPSSPKPTADQLKQQMEQLQTLPQQTLPHLPSSQPF